MNIGIVRRLRRPSRTVAGLTLLAAAAVACSGGETSTNATEGDEPVEVVNAAEGSLESGLGGRSSDRTVAFIMHQDPADPFHATIRQGAEDAAELFNINLNLQTSRGDQDLYLELASAAVADNPAGLAVVLDDPNKYTEPVCQAHDAGIPVIAFNITQPDAAVFECTDAFVGQDFFQVGALVGERLVEEVDLQAGDVVFAPVEFPGEYYAQTRAAGVESALPDGVELELVGTDIQDAGALDTMTQWLLGNDAAAITPLGGTPHRNLPQALADTGKDIPVVGFDVAPQIVDGIKDGVLIATADQQGYIQGFQTIAQIALNLDFGLAPANINSGGSALIDASNVDIVEELAGTVR